VSKFPLVARASDVAKSVGAPSTPAGPTRIDEGTRARRSPHAIAWVFADGAVVYEPERGVLVRLDLNGAELWRQLDGRRSIADVVQELGIESVVADVVAFVDGLRETGLVEAQDAAGTWLSR